MVCISMEGVRSAPACKPAATGPRWQATTVFFVYVTWAGCGQMLPLSRGQAAPHATEQPCRDCSQHVWRHARGPGWPCNSLAVWLRDQSSSSCCVLAPHSSTLCVCLPPSLQENIRRNFGMPQPNGYRKAMRFMRHANKFGLPIITLVDTPGAYAGRAAEELGQVSRGQGVVCGVGGLEH